MDEDQQVAVLMQLNLNTSEGGLGSSWHSDYSSPKHNISVNESNRSDQQEHKLDLPALDNHILQKDFEFVQKHAANADPEFILSLLHSQINNPNRLESIMCEMLNIPNAMNLIREFRADPVKVEDKHPMNEPEEENAKKKAKDTESYLQQMRDMFPDADGLFLISECQQLESWEDFSRFVNTVMLSGVYPKKGAVQISPRGETSRPVVIINTGNYRAFESLSSEDEISSSGLMEIPAKRRRQKKLGSNSSNGSSHEEGEQKWLIPPEVIDLASDNTETYEPPDDEALQEIFGAGAILHDEAMEVEDLVKDETNTWETTLETDIDELLQTKFGSQQQGFKLPDSPTPGPSGLGTRPLSRQSLPGRTSFNFDKFFGEKFLEEIIEQKRSNGRKSLASPLGVDLRPSTSKRDLVGSMLRNSLVEIGLEVSSPEVSTTSQVGRPGSETEGRLEEGEDPPKTNEDWIAEQIANLIRIFPSTDPSYLREQVVKMNGSSEAVNEFVVAKLEKNDMPSRADYEKKLEMEELQNRYTKNFSIEDFLKAVPDPWGYFNRGNRNCSKYRSHSLCYLKSIFRKRYVRDIIDTFNKNKSNLYLSFKELMKEGKKKRGSRRSEFECNHNRPTTIDIQFLQEVAFIENEEKIKDYLERAKIAKQIKFDEAKRTGSLLECQCCYDSEILVEDIFYCPKDHAFCRDCIIKAVEVEVGYGRFKFECLANCEEKFTLACLQNVLKPELFSKVIQAIQMEEIRAAGIEDLVQCPFCNYATIMPPEEKVMTCLNPECLKESCRLCKELNHIPLRCDEVEKSEEVKMRTFIENKMTEALVRTCYKCGKKFVKEDGCNKMTCTCGAKMCYVCRKPVSNYSHFNGQGGTEYHKCPLYSTNDELHVELVKRVGEEAKAEIMQANPNTKLLHDPTIMAPKRTHQAPMPGMNNGAALNVAMRAIRENLNQDGEIEGHRHNRDRREIRREANPYYNRYRRHRVTAEPENETEEDEHNYNHNHHRHNRHRHRLQPVFSDQHHYNNHHHHHHHHHHSAPP